MMEPPQKWKLVADLNETWYGAAPGAASIPPTMRESQFISSAIAVIFIRNLLIQFTFSNIIHRIGKELLTVAKS